MLFSRLAAVYAALVLVLGTSCQSPAPVSVSDAQITPRMQALTAGDFGLDLMLPFPAGSRRQLTQAYMRTSDVCTPTATQKRTTSHCTYGAGIWDDRYALDFAAPGCEGWGAPVLAAAAGTVRIPQDANGRLTRSYGSAMVVVEHDGGCSSQYGHMDRRIVSDGQRVQQGEIIGYEGNRGSVFGSACPSHPGTHLHFKVFCGGEAVRPEPISGYTDLPSKVHRWFEHKALQHPVGTLVKTKDDPRIYQVCGQGTLCHVPDEEAWRALRLWHDPSDEWGNVVTVSKDEIACHAVAGDLPSRVRLVATTCQLPYSYDVGVFVTYENGHDTWRRQVPFARGTPEYALLLRSWGFSDADVRPNDGSCSFVVNTAAPKLALRDGTVIEAASDSDFYVVQNGGKAYRLYRNLMPVLYGANWPRVLQVPDGSVPLLVRGVDAAHPEFTVADATRCSSGLASLMPGVGGAVGGGSDFVPDSDAIPADMVGGGTESAATEPTTVLVQGGQQCTCGADDGAAPGTETEPDAGAVAQGAAVVTAGAERTIECRADGDRLLVAVSGPLLTTLVGGAPSSPVAVQYGSDRDGWTNFGYGSTSPKAQVEWSWGTEQSSAAAFTVVVPRDVGRFNLYILGADGTVGWFDLPDVDHDGKAFRVSGACQVVCRADGCSLSPT